MAPVLEVDVRTLCSQRRRQRLRESSDLVRLRYEEVDVAGRPCHEVVGEHRPAARERDLVRLGQRESESRDLLL